MSNSSSSCVIHQEPQGSPAWHSHRKGRLTASLFGAAIGHSPFTTPAQVRDIMNGTYKTPENAAMLYGTKMEPEARRWYERTRGVVVDQVGFAVPSWDQRIGGSPDGLVGENGIIEIKCPVAMYKPLIDQAKEKNPGHAHIWDSHYAQIQGCLAILERRWCDYIVYTKEQVFVQRIKFDKDYWDNVLYAGICKFLGGPPN